MTDGIDLPRACDGGKFAHGGMFIRKLPSPITDGEPLTIRAYAGEKIVTPTGEGPELTLEAGQMVTLKPVVEQGPNGESAYWIAPKGVRG